MFYFPFLFLRLVFFIRILCLQFVVMVFLQLFQFCLMFLKQKFQMETVLFRMASFKVTKCTMRFLHLNDLLSSWSVSSFTLCYVRIKGFSQIFNEGFYGNNTIHWFYLTFCQYNLSNGNLDTVAHQSTHKSSRPHT